MEELIKAEKKKSFWNGMFTGILATGFILTIVFSVVIVNNSTKFARLLQSQNAAVSSTESSPAKEDNGALIDSTTLAKIERIYKIMNEDFLFHEDVDTDAMREQIYKAIVSSVGDIYSEYYTAEEYASLTSGITGTYYGVGSYVTMDTERNLPYFSGVFEDSPGMKAGIRDGDYIYKVNGEEVTGLTLTQVTDLIKGPENTEVVITVLRNGEAIDFTVIRGKVETPTVTYEMKDNQIGYIQIREFDDVTINQFKEAYETLTEQGMKALCIDLRSNPGGSLSAVLDVCGRILPEGPIIHIEDRYGNRTSRSGTGISPISVPMAVLVNGYSASASEVMTGAIKDYGVGTIIGTKTFGKGIVQDVMGLSDGSGIKYTSYRYLTPSGVCIHGEGIEPDIVVEFDSEKYYAEESVDNQLEYALDFLKEKID